MKNYKKEGRGFEPGTFRTSAEAHSTAPLKLHANVKTQSLLNSMNREPSLDVKANHL